MTVTRTHSLIAVLSLIAILLSACGSATSQSTIATSVAMTLDAEHTQEAGITPTKAPATLTPPPLTTGSPSALKTKAPPTAPPTGGALCNASAQFAGETIPDGTITNPGAAFTKIWRIKNTGTCPWNTTWKFVYVSGDLLGGATIYNFPQVAMPGDTVDVPVRFTAPTESGSYRGYWKIQSPWGLVFGDSSGNAFWVDIVVGSGTPGNNRTPTAYDVTSVTYESDISLIRICKPANTFYHYIAYVTSNGPLTVHYTWVQSDGNSSNKGTITFDTASTKTISADWSQKIGSGAGTRSVQLIITGPNYHEYPPFTLPPLCY